MITVHHLENSRSQRVLWLLEELGVDYGIQRYARDPKTMLAPPELKEIHPLGKSPVVVDGRVTVAESGAIIEYLVETYGEGRLVPAAGSADRRRWTYWLHYAEGSAMPPLLLSLIFNVMPKKAPLLVRPVVSGIAEQVKKTFIAPQLKLHLDYMESELAQRPWFAGRSFTAADIQMSFPVEAAQSRGWLKGRPQLTDWLRRIHARPAYQRALERGGPYQLLG